MQNQPQSYEEMCALRERQMEEESNKRIAAGVHGLSAPTKARFLPGYQQQTSA